jgi:uncharacterized protein (TIGR03435 family)
MKPMQKSRRKIILASLAAAVLTLIIPRHVLAQAGTPAYDAVAINLNGSGSGSYTLSTHSDSLLATNITLRALLVQAYAVHAEFIEGLPSWALAARFDINAKVVDYDPATSKDLTREQRRAMVAALLADRFHLKAHMEQRTQPIYDLVVAKGGPKFVTSTPLTTIEAVSAPSTTALDPGRMARGGLGFNITGAGMELNGTAVRLGSLTNLLTEQLDRNVVDKTGLIGEYDLHMKWTSENPQQPPADDAPPTLFTAIQEQLGLKLQPGKGPVDTLVVDHVEQPTEN